MKGNVQVKLAIWVVSNEESILGYGLCLPELWTNSVLTFTGAWCLFKAYWAKIILWVDM